MKPFFFAQIAAYLSELDSSQMWLQHHQLRH